MPVSMSEQPPKRRWFQLSLRKALLWTSVVAVLLGAMRIMEFGTRGFFVILGGMALMAIVRSVLNPRPAVILWVVVFAIIGVAVALDALWELNNRYGFAQGQTVYEHVFFSCLGVFFGSATGLFTYILGELGCRFINGLDDLMRSGDK